MQAAKYFRLAADQGIAGAQGELGLMYYTGQGVRQNLRLAAQQGMEEAQDFLQNSGNGCTCQFLLDLNGQFVKVQAFGSTSYLADIAASEKGYKLLVLLVERKFIDGMSYNEQLFFLSSFGLLGEPRFRYELYPADSGNHADLWRCFGGLADSDLEYESEAETMFEAKEQVRPRTGLLQGNPRAGRPHGRPEKADSPEG